MLLFAVSWSVTVPVPVTVTAEVRLLAFSILADALPVLPSTLHTPSPSVTVPASVKEVPPGVAHFAWAGPASAVGSGFTLSTTSSVVVQPALVAVNLKMADALVTLTVVDKASLSAMSAVPLMTLHSTVPKEALPFKVKEVDAPPEQATWSAPAFTIGTSFTVALTATLPVLSQPALLKAAT